MIWALSIELQMLLVSKEKSKRKEIILELNRVPQLGETLNYSCLQSLRWDLMIGKQWLQLNNQICTDPTRE